ALSPEGAERLAGILPAYVRPSNPVDTSGGLADDPSIYRRCIEVLAAEPAIGLVVVSQDSPAHFDKLAAEAVAAVAAGSDKCFVFLNNIARPPKPEVLAVLREAGVPYLQGMRPATKAMSAFMAYHPRAAAPAAALDPNP